MRLPDRHRRALALAGPLALASLSSPVLALLDTAIAGHLPGSAYLGAVAVGAMTFNTVHWSFSFLRMGTTGLAAEARGAGRPDEVRAVLVRAVVTALAFGAALAALGPAVEAIAARFFDASPEVARLAGQYLRVRLWAAPASFAAYALSGWFMGMERTDVPLALELVRTLLAATLAAVLALGLGWGVVGIAAASVVAEWATALAGGAVALRLAGGRLPLAALRDLPALKALLGTNVDLFVRTQCILFAFTHFTRGGSGLGDDFVAGNAVLMNLYLLVAYGVGAFGHVGSALVGRARGAGRPEDAREAIRTTTVQAAVVAALFAVALALCGPALVPVLTDIPGARAIAADFLPYATLLPLASVLAFQLDGLAVGAGRTALLRNALLASVVVYAVVEPTLVERLGNHGVWLAFALFMAARSVGFGALVVGRGVARTGGATSPGVR